MLRFECCDCFEDGCFRCAVGFAIASLGFAVDCACFSSNVKPCANRCGRMFQNWESAFKRCEAPYHEWSMRHKGRKGLVVDRMFIDGLESSPEAGHDLMDLSRTHSFMVMTKQDPDLAALELSAEVNDDPISYNAAKYLVASLIQQGNPVPEPLREWCAGVLMGTVTRPKTKGKHAGATVARDKMIYSLINDLTKATGLKPTSSDRHNGQSACHAVALAFSLVGLNPRSYEAMLKIWENRQELGVFDMRDD